MRYYIPNYEECRQICDANENFHFYETKHIVDGYNISIFNYRLCQPAMFYNPIEGKDITAHELRGLTFVWNSDDTLFNRFILLDKFFNLNQYECSAYHIVKDLPIKEVSFKEDGSVASFVKLPNGRIIGKSKASFISDQAIQIDNIYNENTNIKKLVDFCFDNDIMPIFEYVSPRNRIVLQYKITELILIKLRNNSTGEYIDIDSLPSEYLENIKVVKRIKATLDQLIKKCENDTGYEGYVVTFQNGKMVKLKLVEYCMIHELHTEDLHRENSIIYLIINEQIDDILCQLSDEDERKHDVNNYINLVSKKIKSECENVIDILKDYNGYKKEYANKYCKNEYFSICMKLINQHHKLYGDKEFILDYDMLLSFVKGKILNETKKLLMARQWLDNLKKIYEI
jgi:T4 RnlA family RNA ligase